MLAVFRSSSEKDSQQWSDGVFFTGTRRELPNSIEAAFTQAAPQLSLWLSHEPKYGSAMQQAWIDLDNGPTTVSCRALEEEGHQQRAHTAMPNVRAVGAGSAFASFVVIVDGCQCLLGR